MLGSTINIKPLSVNKAWQGKRYKTNDYKTFESELFYKLPMLHIPDGPLGVYLEFGFSNGSSDWDNPIKPFVDVLQKKYSFNDKMIVRAIVNKVKVKKGEDYIRWGIDSIEYFKDLSGYGI